MAYAELVRSVQAKRTTLDLDAILARIADFDKAIDTCEGQVELEAEVSTIAILTMEAAVRTVDEVADPLRAKVTELYRESSAERRAWEAVHVALGFGWVATDAPHEHWLSNANECAVAAIEIVKERDRLAAEVKRLNLSRG